MLYRWGLLHRQVTSEMACPMGGLEDIAVPKPYPRVRDDVVRVARDRDAGVTVEQIAKDFGVHPMTLFKWLRQADIDGAGPTNTLAERARLVVSANDRAFAAPCR